MLKKQPLSLLAINQSTSTLFGSLLETISKSGVSVRLITGSLEKDNNASLPYKYSKAIKLRKSPTFSRLYSWGIFSLQSLFSMIFYRSDIALIVTNPPLVPWLGPIVKAIFGLRYVILVYDIYPDVMERMGLINHGKMISRLLRKINGMSLRYADCIITLGDDMRQTLQGHLKHGESIPIHVIPNWADTDEIKPLKKKDNPFCLEHDLVDQFVVMYSGAFGATHDVEGVIIAAESLQNHHDIKFILIGSGTRENEIKDLVKKKNLPNLIMLPWQPTNKVPYSLAAADCHIVSLDEGFEGISIPSKTYTSLAAGAAILAISPSGTEFQTLVKSHKCGVWIPPRKPHYLADVIKRLNDDPKDLATMKHNARIVAEKLFNKKICTKKYLDLLLPILNSNNL